MTVERYLVIFLLVICFFVGFLDELSTNIANKEKDYSDSDGL